MVENIFALTVSFAIKRRHADRLVAAFCLEVMRCPAGAWAHRPAIFQRFQEAICGEGINWGLIHGFRTGTAIPFNLRYLREAGEHIDLNLRLLAHGRLDLLFDLKMRHVGERSRQISFKSDIVCDAACAVLFILRPDGPTQHRNLLCFESADGEILQLCLIVRDKCRA